MKGEGRVIYHTGPIGEEGEGVRETTITSLRRHPDKNWHPTEDNPNFLGFSGGKSWIRGEKDEKE